MKSFLKSLVLALILLISPLVTQEAQRVFYQQYIPSHVEALTSGDRRYCSGSQIKQDGKTYFVTNRHCCARGRDEKGKEKFATHITTDFKYKRKVLHISNLHDICIAESTSSSGLRISTEYAIGDIVRVIGFPRGLPLTVRKGVIFDIDAQFFRWLPGNLVHKYIHVSATSYPGNSGSPVVDRMGRVVGLLFAGNRMYSTEGAVVPAEYIVHAIEEIK